jgi:hypothetical protein
MNTSQKIKNLLKTATPTAEEVRAEKERLNTKRAALTELIIEAFKPVFEKYKCEELCELPVVSWGIMQRYECAGEPFHHCAGNFVHMLEGCSIWNMNDMDMVRKVDEDPMSLEARTLGKSIDRDTLVELYGGNQKGGSCLMVWADPEFDDETGEVIKQELAVRYTDCDSPE